MSKRLRRGTLTVGTLFTGVVLLSYTENNEFDRTQADNEFSGTPIEMKREGTGEVRSCESHGSLPDSGHQTSDWVFTYYEVTLTAGVETVVEKTVTFNLVTCNHSGNFPSEGRGETSAAFTFATATEA